MRISGIRLTQNYNAAQPALRQHEKQCESKLVFKPVTIDDMPTLRKYMNYNTDRTCDYTLGGLFMWVDYFSYEYCVFSDTLFIKGISENHPGMIAFSLPLGKLPISKAVKEIVEYCRLHDISPAFSAIPVGRAREVADACGGRIEKLDGWSDYMYDAAALAHLQGKSYSKKRNHVNRFFVDNPNWRFEPLTDDNINEAMAFLDNLELVDKADRSVAEYELAECKDVFYHRNSYMFDGALLREEGGAVCALTMGEVIGDTLYVHIEKMNHAVAGAGETINKLFAESMMNKYSEIRYINREEDMNDPGLRFAKESYHPTMLIEKCNVIV